MGPEEVPSKTMDGGALERKLAQSKLDAAQRQLQPAGKFLGFLIASPVVIGTLLLGFVVAAWGVFDHIEGSGTTSTALVVGGALVLVPAVLAAGRGTSSEDHAQEVFEAVQDILDTPTDEELAQRREAGVNDRATPDVHSASPDEAPDRRQSGRRRRRLLGL